MPPGRGQIKISNIYNVHKPKTFRNFIGELIGRLFCIAILWMIAICVPEDACTHKSVYETAAPIPLPSLSVSQSSLKCEPGDITCLGGPFAPERVAAFSFDKHPNSQIAVVLSAERVRIHIVAEVPKTVLNGGAFVVDVDRSSTQSLAPGKPLIFIGDVRVDVGPLAGQDKMLSLIRMHNSTITGFEIAYHSTEIRGPPISRDIYVVGGLRHVEHPSQKEKSYHKAGVFDLDMRAGIEKEMDFVREFRRWDRSEERPDMNESPDIYERYHREYYPISRPDFSPRTAYSHSLRSRNSMSKITSGDLHGTARRDNHIVTSGESTTEMNLGNQYDSTIRNDNILDLPNGTRMRELSAELDVFLKTIGSTPNQDHQAVQNLVKAKDAASRGDEVQTKNYLRASGEWALKAAEKVGSDLIVSVVKGAMGIG